MVPVLGAGLLVEGVRGLAHTDDSQTRLSLTVVGFATAFELVVLAWSAARRGISEAVVAAVVGSFAYNATMTLGIAALVRPLRITDAAPLRLPAVAMLAALALPTLFARRHQHLTRRSGMLLLAAYPLFVLMALVA